MAHKLKLEVVAEGVETAAQQAFLAQHRCDEIQGYHFSRPLPLDELEALLRRQESSAQLIDSQPPLLPARR